MKQARPERDMILIAETVHPGAIHVQVNGALLALFHLAFPGKEIMMIAEKGHVQAIRESGVPGIGATTFLPFSMSQPAGWLYWPAKITGEWLRIIRVVRKARKYRPSLLVWTSLFPTGQWLVRLLSGYFLKTQRQAVVLHGELEYLDPALTRWPERMLRFFLRKGLNGPGRKTSYIVFSDSIKNNMGGLGLRCMERVFVLPHPYHYREPHHHPDQQKDRIRHPRKAPLDAGTFGAFQPRKNVHLFFGLAERMHDHAAEGRIRFHAVGKCPPGAGAANREGLVTLHHPDEFLPLPLFEELVSGLDLALFFSDRATYRFCASGAAHEAIRLGIPVLALQNDYLDWLMQAGPETGILFDNIRQMEDFLREIPDGTHDTKLEEIMRNMRRFREENSLIRQSRLLKNILTA